MEDGLRDQVMALKNLNTAELVEKYIALFGQRPRVRQREFLFKRCAWRIQENRLGGLSKVARARLAELQRDLVIPTVDGKVVSPKGPPRPAPGTVLKREYKGRSILVHVTADGFEWEGTRFGSLSAIANAITGAHWNGRLFFGLRGRQRGK